MSIVAVRTPPSRIGSAESTRGQRSIVEKFLAPDYRTYRYRCLFFVEILQNSPGFPLVSKNTFSIGELRFRISPKRNLETRRNALDHIAIRNFFQILFQWPGASEDCMKESRSWMTESRNSEFPRRRL